MFGRRLTGPSCIALPRAHDRANAQRRALGTNARSADAHYVREEGPPAGEDDGRTVCRYVHTHGNEPDSDERTVCLGQMPAEPPDGAAEPPTVVPPPLDDAASGRPESI